MAVRALPQQLRAPVTAADADVRVDVEDGVLGEIRVPLHQCGRQFQLEQRLPDCLMERQRVRVDDESIEEMLERISRLAVRAQEPRQRQPGTPLLWVVIDQPATERREPRGVAGLCIGVLETGERQVGAVR